MSDLPECPNTAEPKFTMFKITTEMVFDVHSNLTVPERAGLKGAWYATLRPRTARVVLDEHGHAIHIALRGPRIQTDGTDARDNGQATFDEIDLTHTTELPRLAYKVQAEAESRWTAEKYHRV